MKKTPTFSACKLHHFSTKNLLLETDGSLQDLQILCLEWQTRPYCPSKSTVTLWSTDPNKSIMFLSTTTLNQTKWVRLNRKGWGVLNPFPHHPRKNKDKGESLHWPSSDEPCSEGCPLGPGCPKEDGFGVGAFIWNSAMVLESARSVSQTIHTAKSEYPKEERKALMLAE